MRHFLLAVLMALLSSVQAHAQDFSVTKLDKKPLADCVDKEFHALAYNTPDKNILFDKVFQACKSLEDGLALAYKMQGVSPDTLLRFRVLLQEKLKKEIMNSHIKEFNTKLWRAGYITVLSHCPGANLAYLDDTQSRLIEEAQQMDAELRETKIIKLEADYYRITMEVRARKTGIEKWCASERAFLEEQGVTNFFLKN